MKFDAVESRLVASDCRRDERLDDSVHFFDRHPSRARLGVIGGSDGQRADELSR